MEVVVFEASPGGPRVSIDDPGPDYADATPLRYAQCVITSIDPPPPAEVDVGTTVTIVVECTPVEETTAEPPAPGAGDETGP
jgi:hypothetical protein